MNWFADRLLSWAGVHGRTHLPWQSNRTPYRVWVAEVMLQQTQAKTVVSYYDRFLDRFPSVEHLAASTENEILHSWVGLGYYRRALRMHLAASQIVQRFDGEFPRDVKSLTTLPGVGRSTAGAILSCAFDISAPILDANVRRILARFHAVNGPKETRVPDSKLWELAAHHTPPTNAGRYTQAIMDFGATQCVRSTPNCVSCPIQEQCKAYLNHEVDLFPNNSSPAKTIDVTKHQLVILDARDACLLERQGVNGTYARLWETPIVPIDTKIEELLRDFRLPLDAVTLFSIPDRTRYRISNQYVTETVTVAKYSLDASLVGTPQNVKWWKDDEETPLGISVKTRKRIDLAKKFLEKT